MSVTIKRDSLPGKYAGYSIDQYPKQIKKSLYIESFDNTELAADIVFPADENGNTAAGKFPVVLIASRGNRFLPEKGNGDDVVGKMTRTGYIIVVFELRGCGVSFGYSDSFAGDYHKKDTEFIINWIGGAGLE